ncbi:MAG TPA: phosphatase PAP2 family protein [Candidatus Acidoferrum sp.]
MPRDSAMEMHPWLALRRTAGALWNTCGAYEWVALGYLGVSSLLIMLFAGNLAHPGSILAVQAMVAALVIGLCWIEARSAARASVCGKTFATKWWHFWRHWYPHLFFLFCFEELGHLMRMVKPDWQDAKLITFDRWLTGVHPTVWLEQFATPARNDFMQFAYLTYFVYLLVLGGVLYARRDWAAYWSVMTYSMAAYSIGYLIAIFFPIESPWFSMTGSWRAPLAGGPFTAAINFIEHFGRVRGAAFPSEHVAGATAALWGAWKHRRWLFRVMAPLVFLMCISTVWGRYHYVADVLGGLVTGTLGYFIGAWLMRRKGAVAVLGCDQHGRVQSRKSSFGRAFQEEACSKWSANSSKAASPASTPMN